MSMTPEQEALIVRVFDAYLMEHHRDDILLLIDDEGDETHHPVVVNTMTLFEANMEVGDFFNAFPAEVLAIFDEVLQKKATQLMEEVSSGCKGGQGFKVSRLRRTLHARFTGLPVCPELTRHTIPRSKDVGHFLSVTGTVIRTSVAKVLEYERDYMCTKCRHVFKVHADFDQFYTFSAPVKCPNPNICNSVKFSCLSDGSEPATCRDYQEIKIQEQVQRLSVGSIPRSLAVVLEDDLVDSCKSGDDVTIYGVMCLRWKPLYDGSRCEVELVLRANNLEVNNQQTAAAQLLSDAQKEFDEFWRSYEGNPMAGRNQILLSLCPQVFGMYVVKLAVAMVLAGGVQRVDPSGTRVRGECHMLLVGDPGTGKSQFLKYAAKVTPRSVLTAGIGSTSAGLTVAAVKDGGEWHLEAGALVLSDGGLCCIDEFNSIKEHDRISIHEAMEQQSISVAKAGMVCKLNTRTTILAATNPKGQYDPNEPLSVNVALASPLLSRFDLVLVLLDNRNPEWDRVISSFILEERGLPPTDSSALWPMERMRAYFSVIKQLQPQISEEANLILTRYYQLQRQSDGRSAARTTIRMLESLSRLAEAHARLMFRETVEIEDAVVAVSVMECSMQGGALLGNVNALLTSFPADPLGQYQTQCQLLLEGLKLPSLVHSEMQRLSRLRSSSSGGNPPGTFPDEPPQSPVIKGLCSNPVGTSPFSQGKPMFTSTQGELADLRFDPKDVSTIRQGRNGQSDVSFRSNNTDSEETKQAERSLEGKTLRSREEAPLGEETLPKVNESPERQIDGGQHKTDVVGNHEKDEAGPKGISSALGEKMAANASTNLHSKFSSFTFKPRKSMTAEHKPEDLHSHRDSTKQGTKRTKTVEESSSPPANTKKRKTLTAEDAVLRALSKESQSKERNCPGENPPPPVRVNDFTSIRDRNGSSGDKKDALVTTTAEGAKRIPKTSSVTLGAIAKLSRFSFVSSTESSDAQQTAEQTQNQREGASPPRDPPSETKDGERSLTVREVEAAVDQKKSRPESLHAPVSNKRKCFQFGAQANNHPQSGLLKGRSMFECADAASDVLDTDWDQEINGL